MHRQYPQAPIVAVGVIIRQGDQIALIQRAKEPAKGLWTFPGGAIELGESLEEAARREALEETGLEVQIGKVATVIDHVARDAHGRVTYHYVIVDYWAQPVSGTLRPGTDAQDARWFNRAGLEQVTMTEKAGELARELLDGSIVLP
jgi:mutator protein MutT